MVDEWWMSGMGGMGRISGNLMCMLAIATCRLLSTEYIANNSPTWWVPMLLLAATAAAASLSAMVAASKKRTRSSAEGNQCNIPGDGLLCNGREDGAEIAQGTKKRAVYINPHLRAEEGVC